MEAQVATLTGGYRRERLGHGAVVEAPRPKVAQRAGHTFPEPTSPDILLRTLERAELVALPLGTASVIVCARRLNHLRHLNEYLGAVHARLAPGGRFEGRIETAEDRKRRILNKFPRWFAWPYYAVDFVLKRALPKMWLTRGAYFAVTNGRNRVLSKTEMLGRLVYCGFEIEELAERDNLLHFVVRKREDGVWFGELQTGIVLRMERIGQGGRPFTVYKLRTMHPYSRFLQAYIHEKHKLDENGKFKDDFRVASWGRWLRKTWIDELPMFANLFRGQLKLVGVRPLTAHYLALYPEALRRQRLRHKPGLVPPFYADLPQNFEDILASEQRYLEAYEQHPWKTDVQYFFRAVTNILFKGARSQ